MSQFEEVTAGLHRVADPAAMSDLEKKHVPVFEVAPTDESGVLHVAVQVGALMRHPNEMAHWIDWIELWVGESFIARFDLVAVVALPKVSVTLSVEAPVELTALGHCNIHGTWAATAQVAP